MTTPRPGTAGVSSGSRRCPGARRSDEALEGVRRPGRRPGHERAQRLGEDLRLVTGREEGRDTELAQPPLPHLVAAVDDAGHPDPVAGEVTQRVPVEGAQVGGDDRHRREAGRRRGEEVGEVRDSAARR